jgi:NADH:ubiquinone oxidoreductase subunit K
MAALAGMVTCLLAIFFTVFPIIDVPSPFLFALKVIAVTAIANAIGLAIFVLARKRAAQS